VFTKLLSKVDELLTIGLTTVASVALRSLALKVDELPTVRVITGSWLVSVKLGCRWRSAESESEGEARAEAATVGHNLEYRILHPFSVLDGKWAFWIVLNDLPLALADTRT
jgi:hypothetical protein